MRILFLAHSFNSLTQRLFVELRARGHEVSVELDIADSVSEEAVAMYTPDLIIAPFLKRAIPASIWQRHICLVVHPGVIGDRGPSALDWAILRGEAQWGVTVLQANAEMDAGDIWGAATFPMRCAKKSSLYRNEVTAAAVRAVLDALERIRRGEPPLPLAQAQDVCGRLRPPARQADRRIDWERDDSATVLAKIHSADGFPGVLDSLFGSPCYLYDAHPASDATLRAAPGRPGDVVARREHAVLRRTRDGGVWIGHARLVVPASETLAALKLPIPLCFPEHIDSLPALSVALMREQDEWGELRYVEEDGVGYLSFDFYNGAMSTGQCERLRAAVRAARARPVRVLVLLGGSDFFSNGIHLNCIEAAARRGGSPADESWRNIHAMDDLALEIIENLDQLTIAAVRGNAGAGGAFLALAADLVWAHAGVVLNPHYKNMGNLYGSEYWTYLLPRRVGAEQAHAITQNRLPLSADEAVRCGMIDACFEADEKGFTAAVVRMASALAAAPDLERRIEAKRARRRHDEAQKPLQAYRDEELARMHHNFYGFDPSYHVARYHFVHRMPHAWTPRHLALHRALPHARNTRS